MEIRDGLKRKGPKTIIMGGYGINCERETAFAFQHAGADPETVHLNDLIENKRLLEDCNILVFPGGFSMGDDTGSGLAYANMMRNHLEEELEAFRQRDTLALGICNGFQIMTHLGFFPASTDRYGRQETSLVFNTSARYIDTWVNLGIDHQSDCIWARDIYDLMFMPIAHGEGRFYAESTILGLLEHQGQVAFRYVNPDGTNAKEGPANPNGSLDDIAGICDPSGRFLGMMPHPERAILAIQDPRYTSERERMKRAGQELREETHNIKIFRNAVKYFA